MSKEFSPQPLPELTTVYTTKESKAWIKKQAEIHGVSMVAVIDEMVEVIDSLASKQRPNVLREGIEDDESSI
jgi:hypothetical protein